MTARERLATFIAILVASVWAMIALASLLTREYAPLSIATPVMLLTTGYAFGLKPEIVLRRNGKNGRRNGS